MSLSRGYCVALVEYESLRQSDLEQPPAFPEKLALVVVRVAAGSRERMRPSGSPYYWHKCCPALPRSRLRRVVQGSRLVADYERTATAERSGDRAGTVGARVLPFRRLCAA